MIKEIEKYKTNATRTPTQSSYGLPSLKSSPRTPTQSSYGLPSSKSSQAHVEMIISFVIFVGFVLAIFIFINPVQQQKTTYASLDLIQDALIANLSSQISYVPLVINPSLILSNDCFSINNTFNFSGVLTKDFAGKVISSKISGSDVLVQNVSSRLYNLYSSFAVTNYSSFALSGCQTLSAGDYSLGVLVEENRIFIENIRNLNNQYVLDYPKIKENLKLENNFDFVVYNLSRGIIFNGSLQVHKVRNGDNLARDIPMRIVDENVSEMDIIFSLRVW
jgi:hypothetical protein